MGLSGCPVHGCNKVHWPGSLLDSSHVGIGQHYQEGHVDQRFRSFLVHQHFHLFLHDLEFHLGLWSQEDLEFLAGLVYLLPPVD